MSSYKIIVPKVGASNKEGTETKLYTLDEVIDAKQSWQKSIMDTFVTNGWAVEVKVMAVDSLEKTEPVKSIKTTKKAAKKTTKKKTTKKKTS